MHAAKQKVRGWLHLDCLASNAKSYPRTLVQHRSGCSDENQDKLLELLKDDPIFLFSITLLIYQRKSLQLKLMCCLSSVPREM
jgi:hypothetical protein